MEKIMSKSNDASTLDHRPLADSELDAVSGGFPGSNTMIANATGDALVNAIDQQQSKSGAPWPIGW
jgi:hypothetical protein